MRTQCTQLTGTSRSILATSLLMLLILASSAPLSAGVASAQSVTIGTGASIVLSDATVDLGCSDLVVSGAADLGSAQVLRAVDVSIPGGGTLTGGSATLEVTGDWSRSGSFASGSGAVRFVDGCGTASSTILASSTFHDLELVTTTGKQVIFQAGATTSVSGMFEASGASGNLLRIRSTLDGSEAFLALAAADMGDFVDVKDNHAVPSPVTLGLGSLLSGNHTGWSFAALVPAVGAAGLALLAWTVLFSGRRLLRQAGDPRVESPDARRAQGERSPAG